MPVSTQSEPLVMHVDMDAFFAAVEQRDHPELAGRAVVIGAQPGHRGVVSTCSYEARRFGVHSAMPINEAYRRCPDAVYLKPDMSRYTAESQRVMAALEALSPTVEPVSIDEAYVDIAGLERLVGPPDAIGRRAKDLIHTATGLTASVGIAPNRLVAKIASDFDKPDGLTIVPAERVLDFLAPLPVSALRGVGPKLVERLERAGIRRVEQLRRFALDDLRHRFGDTAGTLLHRQSHGIGSTRVGDSEERRSISKEYTFGHDERDPERLRAVLREQADTVARRARKHGLRGRCVQLKIRLENFETHTRRHTLATPTDLANALFHEAWRLLESSGFLGRPVRLIGLGLSEWSEDGQLDLFAPADARQRRLAAASDAIVERFGKEVLGPTRKRNKD